ncbi:MAG: ATP-binding protein [Thermomicrobiales bacterium]
MLPSPVAAEQSTTLADRLEATRRGRFVGRVAELDLFRSALLAPESPFAVLQIYGPGGVGKTALLREFARIAGECGRPVIQLDGRNIDPSPQAFRFAGLRAMESEPRDQLASDPDWPRAGVWLIDTFEEIAALDAWLRDSFLPGLPARSVVVVAGRQTPSSAWTTDLDWAGLTRVIALDNLQPEESQTFLATRGIPEVRHREVLAFTHGHPLALALVADVFRRGDTLATFDPHREPDVVRVLLERLVQDVPGVQHRRALEVCVLARTTTEGLLADVLAVPDAHELFAWLRRLSCIEQGPQGIFPHDLARDALDADLRWRNPDSRRDLVRRLAAHFYERMRQTRGKEQQRIWFDILFLNRKNPYYRPYYVWETLDSAYAEPASVDDHGAIVAMVRRHQGDAAAEIAHYWLRRQPEAFLIYRELDGESFGFMAQVALQDASAEDIAADPAVPAALDFVERHGPLRPGEEIAYLRFWMHKDLHQAVSPAINLTAINSSIHWTSHPRLAWNFIAVADPEFIEPQFTSVHIWRSPDADFVVGGRRFGVFAHDWRVESAADWLEIKTELAEAQDAIEPPPGPQSPPLVALSQAEFAAAVRQALRDYTRPDRLATNPLLRTRRIAGEPGQSATPELLQVRLRETAATLTANPKDAKLHRALWHTYFEPAPTQEQAAELLDLPFNTYRYHLAKGFERVADCLWRRELEG